MGWLPSDEALADHEGWAAYMAPDGRLSGSSTSDGFLVRRPGADAAAAKAWRAGRPPSEAEADDLIPWADLTGWKATCTCGWTGPSWTSRTDPPRAIRRPRARRRQPSRRTHRRRHGARSLATTHRATRICWPGARRGKRPRRCPTRPRPGRRRCPHADPPSLLGRHRPSYRHDPTGCPRALGVFNRRRRLNFAPVAVDGRRPPPNGEGQNGESLVRPRWSTPSLCTYGAPTPRHSGIAPSGTSVWASHMGEPDGEPPVSLPLT